MKSISTILFSALISSFIFISSCSQTEILNYNKLEFINKSVGKNKTSIYKYRFNFEDSAWMEVSAFVKKINMNYVISIAAPAENNLNNYTFFPDLVEQNLTVPNRVRRESASDIDDAIKKAIMIYLADNI